MEVLNEQTYVILEWVDSAEGDGWTNIERALSDPPCAIQSIAILMRRPSKSDPFYIICRDYSPHTGTACGVMRIPKAAVLRIDEFEWPAGFEKGWFDE